MQALTGMMPAHFNAIISLAAANFDALVACGAHSSDALDRVAAALPHLFPESRLDAAECGRLVLVAASRGATARRAHPAPATA